MIKLPEHGHFLYGHCVLWFAALSISNDFIKVSLAYIKLFFIRLTISWSLGTWDLWRNIDMQIMKNYVFFATWKCLLDQQICMFRFWVCSKRVSQWNFSQSYYFLGSLIYLAENALMLNTAIPFISHYGPYFL